MTPCWFHGDDMNSSWRGGAYDGEVGRRRVFTQSPDSVLWEALASWLIGFCHFSRSSHLLLTSSHLLLTSSGLVKLRRAEGGQKALASESGGRREQEGGAC